MKILKIVLAVCAGLLVLCVLGITALLWLVDLNHYKKEIEQVAAAQGVPLQIEGDLGFSIYPNLAIRSGKLTVKPPVPQLAAPITFDSLRIGLQLKPLLLAREIRTSQIKIQGGAFSLQSADNQEITHVQQLMLSSEGLNLQQQPFALSLSANIRTEKDKKILQQIQLDSTLRLSLEETLQTISVLDSHHEITLSGASIPQQSLALRVDFSAYIDLAQSRAELPNLKLAVDDTTLHGKVLAEFGQRPYYQVSLQGDHMDLDRYLAADNNQAANDAPTSKSTSAADEALIPVALLLAFPGEYALQFTSLRFKHLNLSDMKLSLSVTRDGLMTIQPLQMNLYEGQFAMHGTVDVRPAQPQVRLNLSLSPLQLQPALKDYLQVDKTFASGDFAFNAKLHTQGQTTEQFISALNGDFTFHSQSITLNKVDLTSSLDASLLQLLQMKLPALMSAENQTMMHDLKGEGTISQGLVKPVFSAKALCTQFAGRGSYHLPDTAVDYHIDIFFPSADTTASCAEINPRLKDVPWPVACKGTLADEPAKLCAVDQAAMQGLLANMAKKEAGQKLEKKMDEKLKEKFGDDAEQMKGLLKQLLH